ncbi:MAG: ABC-F family ATP-binding cassette domain-containing protein [Verrucomicrobiota bacterium JB022]|nr:ABC-F family ATP-binding cassette domain-containing protein [Verrucomicrobiota bacterium JB022]
MIEIQQLSLRYGPKALYDGISARLGDRDRIGLVGSNGSGKSTLLKVLLGKVDYDGGRIDRSQGTTLGYLPQDGLEAHGQPVLEEVMQADVRTYELQAEMHAASERLHELPHDSAPYHQTLEHIGEIERELEAREAHKLQARAEKVLSGLGFAPKDFVRDCGEFSGGWQMRIALSKLLLAQPTFLLLDEPTNHLDLPSQRWLEQYLRTYPGGLVLISHDRAFLDELTTKTFALSRGNLYVYNGNYSFYEAEHAQRKAVALAQRESQERQMEKTQAFIDRFRAKASKAAQVQSRIKAMDKIELVEIEDDEASVSFKFPPAPRCGATVLEIKGLHKAYGSLRLFEGFDLKIEKGERLAVVGVNGAGKSTLARMMAGDEPMDQGTRELGHQVQLSYFAQHQTESLDPNDNVVQAALRGLNATEQQARDVLGSFLFRGDEAFKPVRVLSGGEKNRLALARMLLQPANFFILDEPTNHLDMQSKRTLQQALRLYDGGFCIISHDRDFLDPIVQKVLEISPSGHRMFWGNVSEYLAKVEADQAAASAAAAGKATSAAVPVDNLNAKERRQREAEKRRVLQPLRQNVERLEAEVERLDAAIATWEEKMKDAAFFSRSDGLKEDMQAYEQTKRDQQNAMEAWEFAQVELEEAEERWQG